MHRSSECKDGLHRYVKARDVEGLEHDLRRVFPVLRRVQRRLRQKEVVVLRIAAQVLEDAVLPVLLHQIPVGHLVLGYRVVNRVLLRVLEGLVPDEKVQVAKARRGVRLSRRRLLHDIIVNLNHRGQDITGLRVSAETEFRGARSGVYHHGGPRRRIHPASLSFRPGGPRSVSLKSW